MDPKGKTLYCGTLPPDVLNNLPESVIDDILVRLPLRDAVRTSILSKKWRYNWCRLPELKLDQPHWNNKRDFEYFTSNIRKIVNHILTFHAGPVTKFTLCIPSMKSCPNIDNLIYFLSRSGIQRLYFKLPFRGDPYELPSTFFTCFQLRHLTLENCLILTPPNFKAFHRLISLELRDVSISSKLLESLISNCLSLQQLVLQISADFVGMIEISAPMLRSFDYRGCIRSICFKNVPLLAKLSLSFMQDYEGAGKRHIAKFFESFSALEQLHLEAMSFPAGAVEIPSRLPFNLNCVKHLRISCIDLNEVLFALCLIRSFPYLQYLEIEVDDNDECLELEHFSDMTFNHLKEVKLMYSSDSKTEMQLIKLLLTKSPMLVLTSKYCYAMHPTKKKHGCRSGSSNLLSDLPENVIDVILMCLPLRDAVRTSILSKKWRYKWCRLPELTLDQSLWKTTEDLKSSTIRFTDIIYHLLTLHVGPITKFTLSTRNLANSPKIDNLICFLSRNGIEHLVLRASKNNPYRLPSSFFRCLQMRHLALHNCLVHPPPAFKGFNKLVSLALYEVTISSEVLECLISYSPLLEQLVLQTLGSLDHIEIKAPRLRSFEFTGSVKYISLKKSPLLVKLQLLFTDDTGPSEKAGKHDLAKYFESFPALESLHFNYSTIPFLTAGSDDIPAKLSSPANCLKCLCLSDICLDAFVELSYALCLITSSPYLQDIQMKVSSDGLDGPALSDEINASFSDVTLNHLRAVMLEGITGIKPEMEFIKLLLARSPLLERMLIKPGLGKGSLETYLEVITVITKFRRASPKAEVDYIVDSNRV